MMHDSIDDIGVVIVFIYVGGRCLALVICPIYADTVFTNTNIKKNTLRFTKTDHIPWSCCEKFPPMFQSNV